MTSPTSCPHIKPVAWREYECGLAGASVDEACGALGLCFPRRALRHRQGHDDLNDLRPHEREVILRMAKTMSPDAGTDDDGAQALSIPNMTAEQLVALKAAIKEREHALRMAQRALPHLRIRLGKLLDQRTDLDKELAEVQAAVEALEEGRVPKNLPGTKPRKPMSPEQRQKMAERMRKMRAAKAAKDKAA